MIRSQLIPRTRVEYVIAFVILSLTAIVLCG